MKILELKADSPAVNAKLLDDMYRMRARIFRQRLGWQVTVERGLEKDEFDDHNPTYLLVVDPEGEVCAAVRLLPAVGPTMLQVAFPQLLAQPPLRVHSAMVESSRFCVDTDRLAKRASGPASEVTYHLLAGILEWCLLNGYEELVTATDLRMERILRRVGWPMERLGDPAEIDTTIAVAGLLNIDAETFRRLVPANYQSSLLPTTNQSRGASRIRL
ncbi:acyl homoserine lactone synthase [Pseudorhizobium tarimense]|uniref:Acyl-homoserine-lactone synthase n=1 Tax=Pseudorhizobium tarimense TaxID=1079109 RepID=A0ABV2HEM0_9HYPH|nr:acyl-homoserine-lactone synthase [Pseudorhizobium tarimense]MCJ8521827.1 GNAT family N-acetyltransferase [Pseudorhizobium tarimense]